MPSRLRFHATCAPTTLAMGCGVSFVAARLSSAFEWNNSNRRSECPGKWEVLGDVLMAQINRMVTVLKELLSVQLRRLMVKVLVR